MLALIFVSYTLSLASAVPHFLNASGHIDTHLHALPPAYIAALSARGGDPSGFTTPSWSPESALKSMDTFGTAMSILSVSSPGVPIAGTGRKARALARTLNHNLGNYTINQEYGGRFSFFGVLPDWRDVDGTLEELEFLYSEQKLCAGVTVYTSYGDMLPGNSSFASIWDALQRHNALIFLHPGVMDIRPQFLAEGLPQPILEYPLATTRAAVDMVLRGILRDKPDIDIILSHAGGTLPYLASRILSSFSAPPVQAASNVTAAEAEKGFKKFFLDTAISTSAAQLDGMLDFTTPDKILFGSDFPYFAKSGISSTVESYKDFVKNNTKGRLIAPAVLRSNAARLLARHFQGHRSNR